MCDGRKPEDGAGAEAPAEPFDRKDTAFMLAMWDELAFRPQSICDADPLHVYHDHPEKEAVPGNL